jgi:hypothetical protein
MLPSIKISPSKKHIGIQTKRDQQSNTEFFAGRMLNLYSLPDRPNKYVSPKEEQQGKAFHSEQISLV